MDFGGDVEGRGLSERRRDGIASRGLPDVSGTAKIPSQPSAEDPEEDFTEKMSAPCASRPCPGQAFPSPEGAEAGPPRWAGQPESETAAVDPGDPRNAQSSSQMPAEDGCVARTTKSGRRSALVRITLVATGEARGAFQSL